MYRKFKQWTIWDLVGWSSNAICVGNHCWIDVEINLGIATGVNSMRLCYCSCVVSQCSPLPLQYGLQRSSSVLRLRLKSQSNNIAPVLFHQNTNPISPLALLLKSKICRTLVSLFSLWPKPFYSELSAAFLVNLALWWNSRPTHYPRNSSAVLWSLLCSHPLVSVLFVSKRGLYIYIVFSSFHCCVQIGNLMLPFLALLVFPFILYGSCY